MSLHGESRRKYSWWGSHISPKNSKWLQENLTDMDRNVKEMNKLIEEDADSFARRAEMYYKKRPELIKLVEDCYRAYRALAERYDHATGALRQAHQTMAEAFPNQVPSIISDESPTSSGASVGPHSPELCSPMRAPSNPEDLHKDAFEVFSNFHVRRRNGAYSEENDSLSSKKGLKQLKELFPSGEGPSHAKFPEVKVRKILNFRDEKGRVEEKEDLRKEVKCLQEEVSVLSTKNADLINQMASEAQHAQNLEETIYKLDSVKEAALHQYKLSVERIFSLETNISRTRCELSKVNDEMVAKLHSIEEQCLAMEKINKSLQVELVTQQKELERKGRELVELNTSIDEEYQKRKQVEAALISLEQIYTHSQSEEGLLLQEIQKGNEKLKDMGMTKLGLEEEINELKEIICNLNEQNTSFDIHIKDLQAETELLKNTKEKLEYQLGIHLEENEALQKELCFLKEDKQNMELRQQGLSEDLAAVSEKNEVLESSLSDANLELEGLREKANALEVSCETLIGEVSTYAVEKRVLVSKIESMSQNMEMLSDKSILLERSLSNANSELEGMRARLEELQERCLSLSDQNSAIFAEKNIFASQVENIDGKYSELQDQHSTLEREYDLTLHEVMELQSSLRLEKEDHEAVVLSLSRQLASLQNQICFLEEEVKIKSEDSEREQHKVMNSLFDIFILQRCLYDMKDRNLNLFGEYQNLLEASRSAEDQIFQLKHKELIQKEVITSLLEHINDLKKGIHLLLEALNLDVKDGYMKDIADEVFLQTILDETKNLVSSISDAQNESSQLRFQVVNLESKYLTLEDQHTNLERDRVSAIHQVMELKNSLRLEKQEHEACMETVLSQLSSLQNQFHLLEEKVQAREEEFEEEQHKFVNVHLENFLLRQYLCDMKASSLILSGECENILEKLRCAEEQISRLKQNEIIRENELDFLSNSRDIMHAKIHLLSGALNIEMKNESMENPSDEVLLQIILDEVRKLLNSISDVHNENQCLHLEILVLVTLLEQMGLDRFHLHHELESREKEKLALASEKLELIEMNTQMNAQKDFLVSQVETIGQSLEMLESKYSELECKNLILGREKDSACHQVLELESSLKLERQERDALLLSTMSQLDSLKTQLDLLWEEKLVKDDELEKEQQKSVTALLEIFILKRSLCDMKDVNLVLSGEYQKVLEVSRSSVKLISEFVHERLIQEKEMMFKSEIIEKLKSGVFLLLKEFNINKETNDGTKSEELIETLLGEIVTMTRSAADTQEEAQALHLEIEVLLTLLKGVGLEKFLIYYELARQYEEVSIAQKRNDEALEINRKLRAETQILGEQLSDLHVSHQKSESEVCDLLKENCLLSQRFHDLNKEIDALEAENDYLLAKVLTLGNLLIFFKITCTERGLELNVLNDEIGCILAVKNGLTEEVRLRNEIMKELKLEIESLKVLSIIQEFDLNMARNFCKEFSGQIEAAEDLLVQKDMEFSETQRENTELVGKLEGVNKDLDEAKAMIKILEMETKTASTCIASKDEKIRNVLKTNKLLCEEMDKLNCDIETVGRRENYLSSMLQKETSKVYQCEEEILDFLNEIQLLTVNATIFEEKVLELMVACESLEVFSMLQRNKLGEEISLKTACIDELKEKVANLEEENGTLKADLRACSPLLTSLSDGIAHVEKHILSVAKDCKGRDDDTLNTLNDESSHTSSDTDITRAGLLAFLKLIAKVETLQKIVLSTKNLIEQERFESKASMEAARKEIEELRLKETLLQEISKEKYVQTVKDIQLDQVSSISIYGVNKNANVEPDDQMLELWETAERDEIEAVEEVQSEHPSSELIAEKELSIDKLEVCTKVKESPREWNTRFVEKLDSDAQRLSLVQKSLDKLKNKLESLEKKKPPKNLEFAKLKVQLRGAEEVVLEQDTILCQLKKKVEDNLESSSAVIWENERKQISEQARKGSEKIGKLEFELQKMEYIFLKVEENEYRKTVSGDRKSSILLREYIHDKKDSKGKRKVSFCGCMRPKTKN